MKRRYVCPSGKDLIEIWKDGGEYRGKSWHTHCKENDGTTGAAHKQLRVEVSQEMLDSTVTPNPSRQCKSEALNTIHSNAACNQLTLLTGGKN